MRHIRTAATLAVALLGGVVSLLGVGPGAAGATGATAAGAPTSTCKYAKVAYQGVSYCPATIDDVKSTYYAKDTLLVLKSVTITRKTATQATVSVWQAPPCSSGFCGATLKQVDLVVDWTAAPQVCSVVNLYGKAAPAKLNRTVHEVIDINWDTC